MATKKTKPKARKFQFTVTITTAKGEDASRIDMKQLRADSAFVIENDSFKHADNKGGKGVVRITHKAGRITEVK